MPLDTSGIGECARRVSETLEQLTIGTLAGPTYGAGSVYGYLTHPDINTATVSSPVVVTEPVWSGESLLAEVNAMIAAAMADKHYGPYVLYYGPSWSTYMNGEFKAASDRTLAERLTAIDDLEAVRRLNYLEGYTLVLVQMTKSVVRLLSGMEIMTVQWDTQGGGLKHFKVMAIQAPQIRSTYGDRCGVVVATTAS